MCIRDRLNKLLKKKEEKFQNTEELLLFQQEDMQVKRPSFLNAMMKELKIENTDMPQLLVFQNAQEKSINQCLQKKIEKNISMGVFIKYININHLMPTRYQITGQIDFKTIVQEDKLETNIDDKIKIKSELAKTLKQKYKEMPAIKGPQDKANHLHFFYKKLRF
eukprot:TRINITY_DN678_c0_g1_i3.p1 TRINITY_DN678_c0_g1~~TRINITY_DN678_c0_g1_i3.p1  ORF type:complete len:164 (-),score=30.69 TRINITY_DN678_c0_g1_i3:181-672(-)